MQGLKVACLQINSTSNISENLQKVEKHCQIASTNGVQLLVTPENVCIMPISAQGPLREETEDIGLKKFQELASRYKIWMILGSLVIKHNDGKPYNRSYLINNSGEIVAKYDKIHLFCAKLSSNEFYRESDVFSAGNKAILAKTPLGAIGLTICYDLRFPTLYRELAQGGAQCIFVPSAFTKTTGQAHWEPLLRARAIENGCYIIAANQCGTHEDGRETYGHSMIISPWGEVLRNLDGEEGMIEVDIDLKKVEEARSKIQSLSTSVPYTVKVI